MITLCNTAIVLFVLVALLCQPDQYRTTNSKTLDDCFQERILRKTNQIPSAQEKNKSNCNDDS